MQATALATEDNETLKVKEKRRQSVKKHLDKTAHSLEQLHEGQPIYYKPFPEARWKRGVIHKKLDERSYIVKDTNGNTYRRNRVHIRRSTSQPDVTTAMPSELREAKEDNTCCNNHPESGYNSYEQVPVTTRTAVTSDRGEFAKKRQSCSDYTGSRKKTDKEQRPSYMDAGL